ncbi:MAG: cupin domain-containing protein [Planctomycetota bacterium]
MKKIVIEEKFSQFSEHWSPHIVAELNGQHVKVAKLLGEFDWHAHGNEDELFWVISGELEMHMRDQVVTIGPGEIFIVPRGVEHKPIAKEEVQVVLFEPASTINTGDEVTEKTRTELPWI